MPEFLWGVAGVAAGVASHHIIAWLRYRSVVRWAEQELEGFELLERKRVGL